MCGEEGGWVSLVWLVVMAVPAAACGWAGWQGRKGVVVADEVGDAGVDVGVVWWKRTY